MNRLASLLFPPTVALALTLSALGCVVFTSSATADTKPIQGPCDQTNCYDPSGNCNQDDPDLSCDRVVQCDGCEEVPNSLDPQQLVCNCKLPLP